MFVVLVAVGSAPRSVLVALFAVFSCPHASGSEPHAVERNYHTAPPSPQSQSVADVEQKSGGCRSCHTQTDRWSMHTSPAVKLGCTDCHGGDASISVPDGSARQSEAYVAAMEKAHVLPRFPSEWPSSANPKRTYTLLNRESPEFVRFVNPSDYRVAREACGACHLEIVEASIRSMHSTGRHVVGRRCVQQRDPALQALHPGRVLRSQRGWYNALRTQDSGLGEGSGRASRDFADAGSVAGMGNGEAGRHIPHLRTRRTKYRKSVSGDRSTRRVGAIAAHRGAGPPRFPSVQSGTRDRRANCRSGHQHHEDATERPFHVVPGHQ